MSDSWYVETLIRGGYLIRELIARRSIGYLEEVEYLDLENEDYCNLLLVEKTLKSIKDNKHISEKERIILEKMLESKSLSQIEQETGFTRATVAKVFERLCDRVAFILGDIFTNDGYLNYLAERNNLTDDQVEIARKYMNSNKKYFLIHKGKENQND